MRDEMPSGAPRRCGSLLALLLTAAVGCATSAASDEGVNGTLTGDADGTQDGSDATDADPDVSPDASPDTQPLDGGVQSCPGGDGCVCVADDDCARGLCVNGPLGSRCAPACHAGAPCADDETCATVARAGATLRRCVPKWGRLCEPCKNDLTCVSPGLEGLACVAPQVGERSSEAGWAPHAGTFCAAPCATDGDCPASYACRVVARAAGGTARQCVPSGGVCPCDKPARAKRAATTCWTASEDGARWCPGVRSCGPDGLSACAPLGGTAGCVDKACIGAVEGAPCDDNDPCTADDGCTGDLCTGGLAVCMCAVDADCAKFEDGDLCNGTLYCDTKDGSCKVNEATTVACPTGKNSACATNACTPATGACAMAAAATGTQCDDGESCTQGDVCSGAGTCTPGVMACPCGSDLDCAGLEDGDACNGTLYCDKSGLIQACKLNPATVVTCNADADTGCTANTCQPQTGACVVVKLANGTVCSDGDACTLGDTCLGGQCGGVPACTCKTDADCAAKEDGDPCNGTLYCDAVKGVCTVNPATVVVCDDTNDTTCLKATCQAQSGLCLPTPVTQAVVSCDDGDACTVGETCLGGACVAGANANVCSCKTSPDCAAKEDGDLCNGTLYCDAGTCKVNPATVVSCPPGSACIASTCEASSGTCQKSAKKDGLACDADGSPCTPNDSCAAGKCVPGPAVCACNSDVDCAAKEDGDLCNGTLYCDKSGPKPVCAVNPATVVTCATVGDPDCKLTACAPSTGKCVTANLADGVVCDDGEPCTAPDRCKGGACTPGLVVCPCKSHSDCSKFDDTNACTSPVCDPWLGCTLQANLAPCDDGNPCTVGDACKGKACVSGGPKSCDDGNACTLDTCAPSKDCEHTNLPEGASCPIGICQAGGCVLKPSPGAIPTVATVESTTCAITTAKTVKCWGGGEAGLLGNGGTSDTLTPTSVKGLTKAVAIYGGATFFCALRAGPSVWCWGTTHEGEFGDGKSGTPVVNPTPVQLPVAGTVVSVDGGYGYLCLSMASGDVACRGKNTYGQIGDGTFGSSAQVSKLTKVGGLPFVKQVATSTNATCALSETGQVWCWGYGGGGSLGNGTKSSQAKPKAVAGLPKATALTMGVGHVCALTEAKEVWCWGSNTFGETGGGTPGYKQVVASPAKVPSLSGVAQVAAMASHTCAMLESGDVYCWGRRTWGALGDGTANNSGSQLVPSKVQGLSGAKELSMGLTSFTCARDGSGLSCWGQNTLGQLGAGTKESSGVALTVKGL